MSQPKIKKSNHLAGSASAYLASAIHQPVEWHPWGAKPFELARDRQKPVLLDIGAVWCHWCHVMDRESYENEQIAAFINDNFVAVKVDRDEMPDVDARYQTAVAAIARQGGWPLTAFLTPDGTPFFGGTYFPPEDRHGRPGFKRILAAVAKNFAENRSGVTETAEGLVSLLRKGEQLPVAKGKFDPRTVVNNIIESIYKLYDDRNGGFGAAPKFPHPAAIDLLLDYGQTAEGGQIALDMATQTLERMARGGVYDQLAGGFHRYSVDERWHVPHFEKMSYDNSELLKNYIHGWQVTGNDLFRETAEGIANWVQSTMSDTERGGFFASQDADIDLDDDGDHFTWTVEEVRSCLNAEEFDLIAAHFNLRERGDMHHDPARNVLALHKTAEELAAETGKDVATLHKRLSVAREKMLAARSKRPTPFIDKTIYTGWNGMMISAFLDAGTVLNRDDWTALALKTLDRLIDSAWSDLYGFAHRCPDSGRVDKQDSTGRILEDQVHMTNALLDAWEATTDRKYLDHAENCMRLCLLHYGDHKLGGFFDRPKELPLAAKGFQLRRKPFQDSPSPAANSLAVVALGRLHHYTLDDEFEARARQTLELFAGSYNDYGLFVASYGLACTHHDRGTTKVVVVGRKDDPATGELVSAARGMFRYGSGVLVFDPADATEDRLPPGLAITVPHLQQLKGDGPVALVCVGQTCQPPITTEEGLHAAAQLIAEQFSQ